MEPFVLVIMEHASAWPELTASDPAPTYVVLRQAPDEPRSSLLQRTYRRMRAIERSGGTISRAVLSCSDDSSVATLEGRVPLARALLATMVREGKGGLDVVARSTVPVRTALSVVALAATLAEATAGTSVAVSTRFIDGLPGGGASIPAPRPRRSRGEQRSAA